MNAATDLAQWLASQGDLARVELFLADINGAAKGKWLAPDKAAAAARSGLAMPYSVFAQDCWGRDVPGAGLALGTGDPDALCYPVPGRWAAMPWLRRPAAQVLMAMRGRDGAPPEADPRGVLEQVVARYAARGLTPVVATEQEFYLARRGEPAPVPLAGPWQEQTLSTAPLAEQDALFDAIFDQLAALGVPADGLTSENGPGQYEINLLHRPDALAAADDVVLLKRVVKAVAKAHGLVATFMAKPYGEAAGCGMHIHASVLDGAGRNVFASDAPAGDQPGPVLRHAVAGLVAAMPGSMLVFAPHANSWRRLVPDMHAPTSAGWGLDDRSAAIRVIMGGQKATRIEHRIAGADCNPYLALAAMLGAMLAGMEAGAEPPPMQSPTAPAAGGRLPLEWGAAITAFAASPEVAAIFGARFRDIYLAVKRQEQAAFLSVVSDLEYAACLDLA